MFQSIMIMKLVPNLKFHLELISKTQSDEKSIRRWLYNKRYRTQTHQRKGFNDIDKKVLLQFFQNQNNHPGPADLELLSII
jgi:hypothetical protein